MRNSRSTKTLLVLQSSLYQNKNCRSSRKLFLSLEKKPHQTIRPVFLLPGILSISIEVL